MKKAGITVYVKYNRFHHEQRMCYKSNPFSSKSLYMIPKVTITSVRCDNTWDVSARRDQRRIVDMSLKAHDTRPDAVRNGHSGKVVSELKETGSLKSITAWTNICESRRKTHIRRGNRTPEMAVYRAGSRQRTDEIQYGIQTVPPFGDWQG